MSSDAMRKRGRDGRLIEAAGDWVVIKNKSPIKSQRNFTSSESRVVELVGEWGFSSIQRKGQLLDDRVAPNDRPNGISCGSHEKIVGESNFVFNLPRLLIDRQDWR